MAHSHVLACTTRELNATRAELAQTRARAETAECEVGKLLSCQKSASLTGFPDGSEALAHLSAVELRALECDLRRDADRIAQAADARHSAEAERTLCVVCMSEQQTHCAMPCDHRCVCAACVRAVSAQCLICCVRLTSAGDWHVAHTRVSKLLSKLYWIKTQWHSTE